MYTAQESPNGHPLVPPPCSFAEAQDQNRSKDSTDNHSNPVSATPQPESFAASACHVPPTCFVPNPNASRRGDYHDCAVIPTPLPDRCQFMFSDGRQCQMARSDIHPSLCTYHSEREEQLFGDPFCESRIVGRSHDLPELFSTSRDLSTAAGVNRALAQVFRLLAQRRISRQEAATFGHLAKLLLRTISLMAAEPTECVIPKTSSPISSPTFADRAQIGRSGEDEESRAGSPTRAAFARAGVDERSAQFASRMPLREISPQLSLSTKPTPLPSHKVNESEPQARGSLMSSASEPHTSSVFCRPASPAVNEERFVLSGCARGEAFAPENQRFSQLPQNQHLQNRETSTRSE